MEKWKIKAIVFLASQCITLFGSSLVQFAVVWYVTLETSSGTLVSALTICAFVPQMLISFVSGVWADRRSKKMLIILSDTCIALATLALALLMPSLGGGARLIAALLAVALLWDKRFRARGTAAPSEEEDPQPVVCREQQTE